jgi:hypothetical protein
MFADYVDSSGENGNGRDSIGRMEGGLEID